MGITRLIRRTKSALRRLWFRLQTGQHLPWSVRLQGGVRLRITDGGRLMVRSRVAFDHDAEITVKGGALEIGSDSYIGPWSVLCARKSIRIGRDCLIAEMVVIRDQNHAIRPGQLIREAGFDCTPVVIGDNVWIGAKATILPGVTIGDNAVIGANAVVTRDVPAGVVVAGAPARLIREIGQNAPP